MTKTKQHPHWQQLTQKTGMSLLLCLSLIFLSACSSSDDGSSDTVGATAGTTDTTAGDTSGDSAGNTEGSTSANTSGNTAGSTTEGTAADSGSTTGSALGPLPDPPLSAAPGQDDEPIAEAASFNTVTEFQVVRDPGPRIAKPQTVTLTDEDFNAGPPPPVISVPNGVDTSTNAVPFFENLANVEVFAGDLLEIVYKPIDPDGDSPGMFPNELVEGSTFDDNFDGSKTYRWLPLQMDVGITEFTVTAIDSDNQQYRAAYTIRIKVNLPDDPDSIPNVAPTLDEYDLHTVRVNDPVVLELKGIDLNGDIPTLELVSNLPNATFEQHPRFDEIYTLRFIPDTVGPINIDVLARDSIDSSLSSTGTVTLNVLAESDFVRGGQRLKDLASAKGIRLGYASLQSYYHRADGAIYADTAASEFNFVTPESAMKMSQVNPEPGRYQFADIDNLVTFAQLNSMDIHGHPILWHRELPQWIIDEPATSIEGHMREYIVRLMSRYKDNIDVWDVVNEPVGDNGGFRESVWFNALGESYIDTAFRQANEIDPDAALLINEFDINFNGPKVDSLFSLLDGLISRNVPIDGVGFQLHLFSSYNQQNELEAIFAQVADRDLDIYITELDVALADGGNFDVQAQVYSSIIDICLAQPRCKAIQTWGFTDQYSFREIFEPLMFDKAYQAKPAYSAMQDALSQ